MLYSVFKKAVVFELDFNVADGEINNSTGSVGNIRNVNKLYYQSQGAKGWYYDEKCTNKVNTLLLPIPQKQASVSFDPNGGAYTDSTQSDTVDVNCRFGGYFDGTTKYVDEEGRFLGGEITKNTNAEAKFADNTLKLPIVKKENAIFLGWYDKDGKKIDGIYSPTTSENTLTAKFVSNAQLVYQDSENNSGKEIRETVQGIGDARKVNIISYPSDWTVPKGKVFTNWQMVDDKGQLKQYIPGTQYSVGSEKDAYVFSANYDDAYVVTVTVNSTGATENPKDKNNNEITELYYQQQGDRGWYYDKTCTNKVNSEDKIILPKKEYTLTIDLDGGSVNGSTQSIVGKSTFTFNGYFNSSGEQFIDGTGKINTSKVIYGKNPITISSRWDSASQTGITLPTGLVKNGYEFAGWEIEGREGKMDRTTKIFYPTEQAQTIRALWSQNYSLTYQDKTETSNKTVTVSVPLSEKSTIIKYPESWKLPAKKYFVGWRKGNSSGSGADKKYEEGSTYTFASETTHVLHPVYKDSPVYTLTFDNNGATTKGTETTLYYQTTGNVGWYIDENCTTKVSANSITVPKKVWTVNFDLDGGRSSVSTTKSATFTFEGYGDYIDRNGRLTLEKVGVPKGNMIATAMWGKLDAVTFIPNPTKTNAEFIGWTYNGEDIKDSIVPTVPETTIKANWIDNAVITYKNTANKAQSQKSKTFVGQTQRTTQIIAFPDGWDVPARQEFSVWSNEEISGGSNAKTFHEGSDFEVQTSQDLYAIFTGAQFYKLTFDNNIDTYFVSGDETTNKKAKITIDGVVQDLEAIYYQSSGPSNAIGWYFDEACTKKIPAGTTIQIPEKQWKVTWSVGGLGYSDREGFTPFTFNGFGSFISADGTLDTTQVIYSDTTVKADWSTPVALTPPKEVTDLISSIKTAEWTGKWYLVKDGEALKEVTMPYTPDGTVAYLKIKADLIEDGKVVYSTGKSSINSITDTVHGLERTYKIKDHSATGWAIEDLKEFLGWSTDPDKTTSTSDVEYVPNQVITVDSGSLLNLYPVYGTSEVYRLQFDNNKATTNAKITVNGKQQDLTVLYYKKSTGNVSAKDGWYYDVNCTVAVPDNATIVNPIKEYKVTTSDNGKTQSYTSTSTFGGFSPYIDAAGKIATSKKLTANSVAVAEWSSMPSITLPSPASSSSSTFLGWEYDGNSYDGGYKFTPDKSGITLVSTWIGNASIFYYREADGSTYHQDSVRKIEITGKGDARIHTIQPWPFEWGNPGRKEFLGWSRDENSSTVNKDYTVGSSITVGNVGAIHLYPVFSDVPIIKLTINNNGATTDARYNDPVYAGNTQQLYAIYYLTRGNNIGYYYDFACEHRITENDRIILPKKEWTVTFVYEDGISEKLQNITEVSSFQFGGIGDYINVDGSLNQSAAVPTKDAVITVKWTDQSSVTMPIPTRKDKIFKRWLLFNTPIEGSTFTPTKDGQVLQADWYDEATLTYVETVDNRTVKDTIKGADRTRKILSFDETGWQPLKMREFIGWSDVKDSNAVKYNPGDIITINGDVTLYTVYKMSTVYKLTLDLGDATNRVLSPHDRNLDIDLVEALYYKAAGTNPPVGWYYDVDCEKKLSELGTSLFSMPSKTYNVDFDANSGDIDSFNKSVSYRFEFTGFGDYFKKLPGDIYWQENLSDKVLTKNETVKASFKLSDNQKPISLPKVTRDGYRLSYWSLNEEGGTKVEDPYTPTTPQSKLVANWKKIVIVKYINTDGNAAEDDVIEIDLTDVDNKNIKIEELPAKWTVDKRRRFLGWSRTKGAEQAEYTAGTTLAVTDSIELYAIFSGRIVYTLNFDLSDATTAPQFVVNENTEKETLERIYYQANGDEGWYLDEDCQTKLNWLFFYFPKKIVNLSYNLDGGKVPDGDTSFDTKEVEMDFINLSSDAHMYTYISQNEYSSFNLSAVIESPETASLKWRQTYVDIPTTIPTKEGYSFAGWDWNGTQYDYNASYGGYGYKTDFTIPGEAPINVVIKARWYKDIRIKYVNTYDESQFIYSDYFHRYSDKYADAKIEDFPSGWATPSGANFIGWAYVKGSTFASVTPTDKWSVMCEDTDEVVLYSVFGQSIVYKATIDYEDADTELYIQREGSEEVLTELYYSATGRKGWYYDKDCKNMVEDGRLQVTKIPTKSYVVTFDLNGGKYILNDYETEPELRYTSKSVYNGFYAYYDGKKVYWISDDRPDLSLSRLPEDLTMYVDWIQEEIPIHALGKDDSVLEKWVNSVGTEFSNAIDAYAPVTKRDTLTAQWRDNATVVLRNSNVTNERRTINISGATDAERTFVVPNIESSWGFTKESNEYFLCWRKDSLISGDSYYPGDKIVVDSSLILYAIWGKSDRSTILAATIANDGETRIDVNAEYPSGEKYKETFTKLYYSPDSGKWYYTHNIDGAKQIQITDNNKTLTLMSPDLDGGGVMYNRNYYNTTVRFDGADKTVINNSKSGIYEDYGNNYALFTYRNELSGLEDGAGNNYLTVSDDKKTATFNLKSAPALMGSNDTLNVKYSTTETNAEILKRQVFDVMAYGGNDSWHYVWKDADGNYYRTNGIQVSDDVSSKFENLSSLHKRNVKMTPPETTPEAPLYKLTIVDSMDEESKITIIYPKGYDVYVGRPAEWVTSTLSTIKWNDHEGFYVGGWSKTKDGKIYDNSFPYSKEHQVDGDTVYVRYSNGLAYDYSNTLHGSIRNSGYVVSATDKLDKNSTTILISSSYDDGVNGKGYVRRIAPNTFRDMPNLTKVEITDPGWTIDQICSYAFANSGITDIEFAKEIELLEEGVFSGCTNIETATFSNTYLKKIPAKLFEGCTKLTSISLTNRITSIGENAFPLSLNEITYGGSDADWKTIDFTKALPWGGTGTLTVKTYTGGILKYNKQTGKLIEAESTDGLAIKALDSTTKKEISSIDVEYEEGKSIEPVSFIIQISRAKFVEDFPTDVTNCFVSNQYGWGKEYSFSAERLSDTEVKITISSASAKKYFLSFSYTLRITNALFTVDEGLGYSVSSLSLDKLVVINIAGIFTTKPVAKDEPLPSGVANYITGIKGKSFDVRSYYLDLKEGYFGDFPEDEFDITDWFSVKVDGIRFVVDSKVSSRCRELTFHVIGKPNKTVFERTTITVPSAYLAYTGSDKTDLTWKLTYGIHIREE